VLIVRAHEKIDKTGRLTHEPTRAMLRKLLDALLQWAPRVAAPRPS
jgi:hypothetical protein